MEPREKPQNISIVSVARKRRGQYSPVKANAFGSVPQLALATLLIEQWSADDWSQLWWVRAELRWQGDLADRAASLAALLAEKYPQYRSQPFARVLVLRVVALTGWSAASD